MHYHPAGTKELKLWYEIIPKNATVKSDFPNSTKSLNRKRILPKPLIGFIFLKFKMNVLFNEKLIPPTINCVIIQIITSGVERDKNHFYNKKRLAAFLDSRGDFSTIHFWTELWKKMPVSF